MVSAAERTRLRAQHTRRRNRVALAVGVAALVLLGGVLVAYDPADEHQVTGDAGDVSMVEMAFDPDPIEVDGPDIRLAVRNDGTVAHDLVLPELGKGTADQAPGTEAALVLEDVAPGTYLVICDLPGHREAGMETELIVR